MTDCIDFRGLRYVKHMIKKFANTKLTITFETLETNNTHNNGILIYKSPHIERIIISSISIKQKVSVCVCVFVCCLSTFTFVNRFL